MHSSRPEPGGSSRNSSNLRRVFVRRVHQLVQLGYERLRSANKTGLARHLRQAPSWISFPENTEVCDVARVVAGRTVGRN